MASDALEFLLRSLDEPAPAWDGVTLVGWPVGRFQRLQDLNLLVPGPIATHVVCPNCDLGHVERVQHHNGQMFISCEGAVVGLGPDLLRTWVPDRAALAGQVRQVTEVTDRLREVVPGRLWQLGAVQWEGVKRRVMLAIGLHWADGERIARSVGLGGKPVVLVPSAVPGQSIWSGLMPPFAALVDVLLDDGRDVGVDQRALVGVIREADELNAASLAGVVADPKLKLAVRRAVKSEIKAHLTDDELTRAYELHNSADKAVAAFAARGVRVHRNQIYRALKRQQEKMMGLRDADAGKLSRVPSHKRDKPKK